MWYIAAIPFVLLTGFFIYNMVAERRVHLAIEDEKGSENDHGRARLVQAISNVLSESAKRTGVESSTEEDQSVVIRESKLFGQGSIVLSVEVIKDPEIKPTLPRYAVERKEEPKETTGRAD